LSVSRASGRLGYSRLNTRSAIWSLPVPSRGPASIREAVRLTPGNETIEDVDVSADGRWLTFDSDRNGNPDLYVMPATGGEARQLTTSPAGDFSPDWSPDGRRIVFHALPGGNRDIYSINADGTGLEQWTFTQAEEIDPDWAPGDSILYEILGDSVHEFQALRLTQGGRGKMLMPTVGDFAHWSPDGKAIVYHSPDGIRLRHGDSGAETLLVSNASEGLEAYYAAWSPDGSRIYFTARTPAGWTIRSVPVGGGPSLLLVNFDDPTRQYTKYGFCTDGARFYLTIGSPESDIYVAEVMGRE
jgi:Tol biopolymer transport system component